MRSGFQGLGPEVGGVRDYWIIVLLCLLGCELRRVPGSGCFGVWGERRGGSLSYTAGSVPGGGVPCSWVRWSQVKGLVGVSWEERSVLFA